MMLKYDWAEIYINLREVGLWYSDENIFTESLVQWIGCRGDHSPQYARFSAPWLKSRWPRQNPNIFPILNQFGHKFEQFFL